MAGLLLLLMTLATFGSCYLTDTDDSSPHNLARRQNDDACDDARDDWTIDRFESCNGRRIVINGRTDAIDLSNWPEGKLVTVFSEKQLKGGFVIRNSEFVGTDIDFTLYINNKTNIIIENNLKLVNFSMSIVNNRAPYVRVSGNRKLNKDDIEVFDDMLTAGKIDNNSYIQDYGECDLNNETVGNVAATLAGCKAIYGDLILDEKTVFPSDEAGWNKIEKLAYVQGCLRITGTKLTSWKDFTILDGTTSKGGCTAGHEISGNLEMCIHPPLAEKLKEIFPDMKIKKNKECKAECTSRHVLEKADSTCVIITDSLVIDATTTQKGLAALANVEEIQGLFQVIKTKITDFKYLPKLTKLNSKKISVGPVITIQLNSLLTSFDLPQLQASGLGTGRAEQIKFWADKNGPDKKYDGDEDFLRRIGAENSRVVVSGNLRTTEAVSTTTVVAVTAAKQKDVAQVFSSNKGTIILFGLIAPVIFVALIGTGFVLVRSGVVTIPRTWKSRPMKKPAEQRDIYQYHQKNEFIQMARKIIEENKPKIEAANLRHRDNRDFKLISILNHMATSVMPGRFQSKDFEQNQEFRRAQNSIFKTLKLPAQINGCYGLAFEKAIGGKYPEELKYRTQCDQFQVAWFDENLTPIYEEKFASTAKRMCHKPCDVISENLRYLRNNSIKIPEFGITTQGFQTKNGMWGKLHGSRLAEEKKDLIWMKDQIPFYKFHRYRQKMNDLGTKPNPNKFEYHSRNNLHDFVIRMVKMIMSMPVGHVLNLTASDVLHVLRIIFPTVVGKAIGIGKAICMRSLMSAGEYSVPLNRTHVRIVGELRGDFDALRRAINIPSLLEGKEHPMLQYNWVFLGNYTGRHPQSLETIMFLLSLQFLYGRDCIVLLRGVMEFADTSEDYGFKDNLKKRFGKKEGEKLWNNFIDIFARLPLNCHVLHAVYCCSGGFNDGDVIGKGKEAPFIKSTHTTLQSLNKIFSLPNYTVRDYFENADTGAGYYYGERSLQKIADDTECYTFFTTGPMTGGVGYFGDTALAQLFMLSSVKNLHGHGGMVTQVAAVAELNGQTGRVTFHMILEEDQMVYYDTQQMELRNTPFEQEEDGQSKKRKKTKITSTTSGTTSATGAPTDETTTPAGNKTASSKTPDA